MRIGRYYDYTSWGFIGVRVINFGVWTRITLCTCFVAAPAGSLSRYWTRLFWYLFDAAYRRSFAFYTSPASIIITNPSFAAQRRHQRRRSLLECTIAAQFVLLIVYRGCHSLSSLVARSASETGQSFFGVAAAGNKKTLFQDGLVERTPFTFAERATINHPNLGTQADPSHFGARAIDCHSPSAYFSIVVFLLPISTVDVAVVTHAAP
jgi:hypothetical protein